MADAASKPRRSPERAAAVLDRAARMQQFRPGFMDRRLLDAQMKTPGHAASPFSMTKLDPSLIKGRGEQMIPISKIRSEQPTISLAAAKAKLSNPTGSSKLPQVVNHNGTYWVADGNHRVTAARALGETHIRAQVGDLNAKIKPPLISGSTVTKGLGMASNVAGPLAVGANAAMAWSTAKNEGKSDAAAAGAATVAGTKTAGTGMAIGAGVKVAAGAGLKTVAALGRAALPLSIVGHAIGYGVAEYRRGGDRLDILAAAGRGALNGVVPIDLTTQAMAALRNSKQQTAAKPSGGDTRLSAGQQKQFADANASFSQAQKQPAADPSNGNSKRGTQNETNLQAILAARTARAQGNQ